MKVRVERDRHYECSPARCVAAVPSARRLQGRPVGTCRPRRCWWLRINRAGWRKSYSYTTEAEAREERRKLEAAAVLGQDYHPKVTTPTAPLFRTVAEQAIQRHIRLNALGPSTIRNHRTFLAQHLLPAFGDRPMTDDAFGLAQIKDFIAGMRGTLKDSTLKNMLPTLAIILDYATEHHHITKNPMRGVRKLWRAEAPEEITPFPPVQLRAVLSSAAAINPDFGVFVQTVAQTGMRPGEALALRRCDLDVDRAEIHVSGTWSLGRRGPTKSRKTRVVSLLYPVTERRAVWRPADAGAETRKVLDGLRGLKVVPADPEGRLWDMSRTTLDRLWRRTLKRAGLPYRKPHTLRHSFASILLSRGGNPLAIQKAGGWASGQVLYRTYAKWIEQADGAETANASATTPATMPLTH